MDPSEVRRAAATAGDHPALQTAARVGYAGSGVLHLLIGWLALQVAWGRGEGTADQSGALAQLASTGLGRALLWVAVVGFVGLALWQVGETVVRRETSDRVKAAAKAVVYVLLAGSAFTYAQGSSGPSSSQQSVDVTARLLEQPAGRLLVGAVGLGVVAVGGYHVYKGYRRKFLEDLREHPGPWVVRAGIGGYVAKGVALALVGALFLLAAVRGNAQEATGLDGALKTLLSAPAGQLLLTLVALGFAAFAAYSFARARYARI